MILGWDLYECNEMFLYNLGMLSPFLIDWINTVLEAQIYKINSVYVKFLQNKL